jgi:hypothetical protein
MLGAAEIVLGNRRALFVDTHLVGVLFPKTLYRLDTRDMSHIPLSKRENVAYALYVWEALWKMEIVGLTVQDVPVDFLHDAVTVRTVCTESELVE